MGNFDLGNIAIGAAIVGILDFLAIVLVKTEAILKSVERIKKIVRLDYRARAKRIDDEIRMLKKYELIARERTRRSFVSMVKWDCRWIWNWSDNMEPTDIKAFCIGNRYEALYGEKTFHCNYPVIMSGATRRKDGPPVPDGFTLAGLFCTQEADYRHHQARAIFEIPSAPNATAADLVLNQVRKAVMSERDLRISREIQMLRWQFWR